MSSHHTDTHPEAESVQIDLLRKASPARRLSVVRSLSRTTIELSRRAIRRRMPAASETELALAFVELHYGRELAQRLELYLAARR